MKRQIIVLSAVLALSAAVPFSAGAEESYDLVLDAEASSTLIEPGYDNSAWRICDGDPSTTWAEGVDGPGYGESLVIYTEPYAVITGGYIYPGFYISEDLFLKNNAPTMLSVRTGQQEGVLDVTEYASYYDELSGGYHFLFDEPLVSDGTVHVTITGVRKGWKYDDTCISELHFTGFQGSAGDLPVPDEQHPHVSVAVPDESWIPDDIADPDGIGGDGLGPDEIYGSEDPELLDYDTAQQLTSFCEALYQMHCHFVQPEILNLRSSGFYSYTRAYMLNWYQNQVSDIRIWAEDGRHEASAEDLKEILRELFSTSDPDTDLAFFCTQFGTLEDDTVYMQTKAPDGKNCGFYFDYPYDIRLDGERLLLTGSVIAYAPSLGYDAPVMTYRAGFLQDDDDPGVYRFDELRTMY